MSGKHTAKHHEIRACAKRFRYISTRNTAPIRTNETTETMRGIRALNDCRELGVANTSYGARDTHRARANTNFYNISAGEYQLFSHLPCNNISSHDDASWRPFSHFFHKVREALGVTISPIYTNKS